GSVGMGAFTIPQIDIPALNPNVTGSVTVGPISIAPVTIPAIIAAQAVLDRAASVGSSLQIEPFIFWSPNPGGIFGPTWYSLGTNYSFGDLFVSGNITLGVPNPMRIGPIHAVFNATPQAFNTPALSIGQIPLNFRIPGSIGAITIFPGGLTFPANSLLNLDV